MQIFTADILPSQQVTVEKVFIRKAEVERLLKQAPVLSFLAWLWANSCRRRPCSNIPLLVLVLSFCCWTKADFRNQEAVKKKSWQKSSGCAENLHRETSTMHDNHLKLTIQLIYFCLCDKIKRLGCGGNESDNPRPFITSYRINIILFAIQTLFKITFVLESIRSPAL